MKKTKMLLIITTLLCLVLSFAGAQSIKAQYKCNEPTLSTNQIKPILNLVNTGSSAVNLSNITIRYFLTVEGSGSLQTQFDYVQIGSGNVSISYKNGYAEIAFGSYTLNAGAQTGEIQVRINKSDWTNLNQSNDFSFDATYTSLKDYQKVAVYAGTTLIWGLDLADITPTPTPVPTAPPTPFPTAGLDVYTGRFITLWNEIHDPANGYFSPEGAPYHAVETLMCEAPDYGHETTSEAYSYYIWLEAAYAGVTGNWDYLYEAWNRTESHIIPSAEDQPGNGEYDPTSPASYAGEWDLPDDYPSELGFSTPVGADPVSAELKTAYGDYIYGMHWLLDCDNFYGYGNHNDGVSKPSYINTFQRGVQESVWETVPHPSWDEFKFGGPNGFVDLFVGDSTYASQWRYTNAPDADARVVQAMVWAKKYADAQGVNISDLIAKTTEMGDWVRLSFFDKYFKTIAANTTPTTVGNGYDSAHYLISWYYAWGGGIGAAWAWRIGCSHVHYAYQNQVAAWALGTQPDFAPKSANGAADWAESLDRQIEFFQWLQSKEGAFAGGATNSWLGRYAPYPAGVSTFYGMAYDESPVYEDPGSNTWFGWQAWGVERLCEYYYLTGDSRAEAMLDKWVPWVVNNTILTEDGDFEMPVSLVWSGQPDTWNGTPSANTGLSVTIDAHNKDVGIAGCTAKALIYYAKGTEIHKGNLNTAALTTAKEILDRMWNLYRDDKGVAAPETRGDYSRFFEQVVYIPSGWTGKMANGDDIKSGVTFLDIRSGYRNDPLFPILEAAYNSGQDPTFTYHRTWAQIDVALANLTYAELFGDVTPVTPTPTPTSTTVVTPTPTPTNGGDITVPGAVWVDAPATASEGTSFVAAIKVNSGTDKVAAYGFDVTYDASVISIDGDTSIAAGTDGYVSAVNTTTSGLISITGFDVSGKGPGTALNFLTITFNADTIGTSAIGITVNSLNNASYATIGTPAGIGDSVEVVSTVLIGDVNGSGVVDIVDALMTAQYYVGLTPPGFIVAAADVNNSGTVDIVDALIIAQHYVGLIPSLPV